LYLTLEASTFHTVPSSASVQAWAAHFEET
jgi:hypothetical protein